MKAIPPIRWSLAQAQTEFATHRDTIHKRLTALSQLPGEDDRYSTGQIVAAVFGDLAGEKLGKARADREKAEIEAAKARGAVVLKVDAESTVADYASSVRSVVESAKYLTAENKSKLFASLETLGDKS